MINDIILLILVAVLTAAVTELLHSRNEGVGYVVVMQNAQESRPAVVEESCRPNEKDEFLSEHHTD